MRSLVGRITLLQQAFALAIVLVFAASSLWLTNLTLHKRESQLLKETADRIALSVDLEQATFHDLARAARETLAEEIPVEVEIDIFDRSGRLLASTASHPTSSGSGGKPARLVARHRDSTTSAGGLTVVTSVSTASRDASLTVLARSLLLCAVPLLLLVLGVSRWFARRALRPLEAMERRARNASVDHGVRSLGDPSGVSELDRLRESFDRLLVRLDDLLDNERRFTSDASHELRTPLTAISGEIEMALADPATGERARAGLARAARQAATMRELVEALLLLRRAGAGGAAVGFEPVNLADLARDRVRDGLALQPDRIQDLILEAPDELMVNGHLALLGSAVQNLIENALKFSDAGSPIRIRMGGKADGAWLSVEDGGPGIPAEERERIFDPFYRSAEARARGPGFGLGLALLRRVARAHGGDVMVESSDLGGARMVLRLPGWQPLPSLDPLRRASQG